MKLFKSILLAALIAFIPVKNSHGAFGAVMSLLSPGSGVPIALAGLATAGGGLAYAKMNSDDMGRAFFGVVMFYTGLILLDEDSGEVSFDKISSDESRHLTASADKIAIYNSEIDEVNTIFEEVVSGLNKNSTANDAKALWDDMSEFISPETYEVMQEIANK